MIARTKINLSRLGSAKRATCACATCVEANTGAGTAEWISASIVLILAFIFHVGCIEQNAALKSRKGALLWVISASDGKKLAKYELGSISVWDGMGRGKWSLVSCD